jgi:hypothetical protein
MDSDNRESFNLALAEFAHCRGCTVDVIAELVASLVFLLNDVGDDGRAQNTKIIDSINDGEPLGLRSCSMD